FGRVYVDYCKTRFGAYPPGTITHHLIDIAEIFYDAEQRWKMGLAEREQFDDPIQRARYRDGLLNLIKVAQEDPQAWVAAFIQHLLFMFDPFIEALPTWALTPKLDIDGEPLGPTSPVIDHLEDVGHIVERMIVHACSDFPYSSVALKVLREQLYELGGAVT